MTAAEKAGFPQLENYELLEEIGHGGMATVYKARDRRLEREVAVKIIHRHLRQNREVATRFVSEAKAAASLKHPNIVEVFDVSDEGDSERFLVVELVRGRTLRKIIEQHAPMPAEVVAALGIALCDALEHAHESGIIHRDVKPENVLLEMPSERGAPSRKSGPGRTASETAPKKTSGSNKDSKRDDGEDEGAVSAARSSRRHHETVVVKLTDFGIAKLLDAQGVTATGQVLGSPAHMAPEQIEGGEIGPETDVFALGVLLYECMVGHLPFEGKNPAQVLRRVLDGIYSPAEMEEPLVGGVWSKILDGALAREREERTGSPAELAEQLRAELSAMKIQDPQGELLAFLEDEDGYRGRIAADLVPVLSQRGERAKRDRKMIDAACHFNRALALSPGDASIMKKVRGLSSSRERARLLRRAGIVLAALAGASVLAYGVVRLTQGGEETTPIASETPGAGPQTAIVTEPGTADATATDVAPPPETGVDAASPETDVEAPTSTASSTATATAAKTGPVGPAKKPDEAPRKVRFNVIPKGARFELDGKELPTFGETHSLKPGTYSVRVTPPDNSECCKALSTSVTIKPAPEDAPDKVQPVTFSLPPLPSQITLAGGPPGATMACVSLGLTVSQGAMTEITLPAATATPSCTFSSLSTSPVVKSILLQAGISQTVSWPSE